MRPIKIPIIKYSLVLSLCWLCLKQVALAQNIEIVDIAPKSNLQRPNIILIVADDLGWGDVGFHGSPIQTPHIDQLAKEGLELDRFYVNPACTPSRAAILSGQYPGRAGLHRGVIRPNRKGGMPSEMLLLPEMLAEIGYEHRACLGKWHLGHSHVQYHPLNNGFTYFYGHYGGMVNYYTHKRKGQLDWHRNFDPCYDNGYATDLIGNEAVRFIEQRSPKESFFMYVAFNAPHTPLQSSRHYLEWYDYDPKKGIYSDTTGISPKDPRRTDWLGQGNTEKQTYSAMVSNMDDAIGRILEILERKKLTDQTLVIFISDNGGDVDWGANNLPYRGEKGQYYEGGIRVPAIIRWPEGGLKGGGQIDAVTGHIDIMPTIGQITGASTFAPQMIFDGESIYPLLLGDFAASQKERLFYLGEKAFCEGDWKLINGKELYYLVDDPYEKNDLAVKEPERLQAMQQKLKGLNKKINKKVKIDESYKVRKEWRMEGMEGF